MASTPLFSLRMCVGSLRTPPPCVGGGGGGGPFSTRCFDQNEKNSMSKIGHNDSSGKNKKGMNNTLFARHPKRAADEE